MRNTSIIRLIMLLVHLPCCCIAQKSPAGKKLIEFGWDYPSVSTLVTNITTMEKQPFDGLVFSFDGFIVNAFDTIRLDDKAFQFDKLGKIRWKKFTDNFLFVRGISATGAHWLDDKSWETIVQNLKNVSKAVKLSNAKGIGFDVEYYYDNPDNNPWIYKPALYKNLSYQQVGFFVKKRGKQFMEAIQSAKPDIQVLSFWLLELIVAQSRVGPIADAGMALIPFFIEGMLEAKNSTAAIIDGNEESYWYQDAAQFISAGEYLRNEGAKLLGSAAASRYKNIPLAQSVYFDGLYAKHAMFEKGFDKKTKEQWLRNNLYHAYKTSDKYIWFYDEKIDWWKNKVDTGVKEIIESVRADIFAEQNKKAVTGIIADRSVTFNFKETKAVQQQDFTYNYIKTSNSIRIKKLNEGIKNIRLFQNSRLIYTVKDPGNELTIPLDKKYNGIGTLIIIAEAANGRSAVSYVN